MTEFRYRHKRPAFDLPNPAYPSTYKCVQVWIPDSPDALRAMYGALRELTYWSNWRLDGTTAAKDAAYAWRLALDNHPAFAECEECMSLEFRQLTPCVLEYSTDGGVIWHEAYNGYNCALEAIQDKIEDGTIAPPSQQGPGGEVPVDQCWDYMVTLGARDVWHSPVPISAGYSVTISLASGGWWDGDINDLIWSCPTGSDYALGSCVGDPEAGQETDPAPALPHMRVIGHYGTSWIDPLSSAVTIPAGVPETDLFIQANDGTLSDNQGSVSFKVTICNYSQWCYLFDFTLSNGGWEDTRDSNNEGGATWVSGQGWQSVYNPNRATQHINLMRVFDNSSISYIGAEYDLIINGELYKYHAISVSVDGVAQYGAAIPAVNGNNIYTHNFSPNIAADQIVWEMRQLAGITEYSYLRSVEIHGNGINPFGTSNC